MDKRDLLIIPKHLRLVWCSDGRKAQCPPNPRYPHGMIADLRTHTAEPGCVTNLEYPAEGCGSWLITCHRCGIRVAITAAGRPDDPNSAIIACKPMTGLQ